MRNFKKVCDVKFSISKATIVADSKDRWWNRVEVHGSHVTMRRHGHMDNNVEVHGRQCRDTGHLRGCPLWQQFIGNFCQWF